MGIQRAIEGASLDVIKARQNQKPEVRAAAREAALREIKEKKKQEAAKKKTTGADKKAAEPKKAQQTKAKTPAASKGAKAGGKGCQDPLDGAVQTPLCE